MSPPFGEDEVLAPTQLRELRTELLERISSAVRDGVISANTHAPAAAPRRIVAERDGRLFFIAQADIDSVVANRNYVNIHANGETFTLRWTMQQAVATLEADSLPARAPFDHRESAQDPRDGARTARAVRDHADQRPELHDRASLPTADSGAPQERQVTRPCRSAVDIAFQLLDGVLLILDDGFHEVADRDDANHAARLEHR